jgi:hypothetical protein
METNLLCKLSVRVNGTRDISFLGNAISKANPEIVFTKAGCLMYDTSTGLRSDIGVGNNLESTFRELSSEIVEQGSILETN